MKLTAVLPAAAVLVAAPSLVAASSSAFAQGMSGQGPNTVARTWQTCRRTRTAKSPSNLAPRIGGPASENSGVKQEK